MTDAEAAVPTKVKRTKKAKAPTKPKTPNPCYNAALVETEVPSTEWEVTFPFAPSNQQLKAYLLAKRHKGILNRDRTGFTFDDAAIAKLMKKYPTDPLYPAVLAYREVEKCYGTYVKGIHPGADGRVHGEYTHKPRTLRLSMRNPNLQNLPRVEEAAAGEEVSIYNRVREQFWAAPGHVLFKRDFAGIEARIVSYLAADPLMTRLTALDIHTFFASHVTKQPIAHTLSDTDFLLACKEWRKRAAGNDAVRTACKQTIYLSLYYGTPYTMMEKQPKLFPDTATAAYYQDFFFDIFPTVRKWQWATCHEAERYLYVLAPDGYRLWHADVFRYEFDAKWDGVLEGVRVERAGRKVTEWEYLGNGWRRAINDNGRAAINAKAQYSAMLFLARAAVALGADPLVAPTMIHTIHDELMFECAEVQLDAVAARTKDIMEIPHPSFPLDPAWGIGTHLNVGTEGASGRCWAAMDRKHA